MISMQCTDCKNYTGVLTCDAYTDRIPQVIIEGIHDHTEPFKGDNGIRFEPVNADNS